MKVCVVQIENILSIDVNIKKIITVLEKLEEDCKYIVLPEGALTGYTSNPDHLNTIDLDDPRLISLQKKCYELNKHIFVGAAITGDYNGYLHLYDSVEVYYKTHLGTREKKIFKAGETLNTFETEDAKFATAICLESHIPEIFLTYRSKNVQCMLVPFASPSVSGSREKIWKKYLPSRSYDFGMVTIGVNLVGHLNGLSFGGGIIVIDAKGNILTEYYGQDEHYEIVDLDLDLISKVQEVGFKSNYFDRRIPKLYEGV